MRVVTMTLMAAVLAAVGVCGNKNADYVAQFELFKSTHGRQYLSASEEAKRLGYFVRNMQKAAQLEAMNPHARFGANEFADMSEDEFKTRHNGEGHYRAATRARLNRKPVEVSSTGTFAQSADWRKQGIVTAVKNQGQCGSCWSFSTTGNIEGQWAKAGNQLVSLSEQELVSCDTTCHGCNGGLMDLAFEWLVDTQNGGITSEAQYPYVSGGGAVPACDMNGKTPVAWIQGHKDLPHDEKLMAEWMSTGGPVSIGVDASSWQTYMGGVMTNCQATQVDHGVLAVGYDLSANPPYWIIKNSWGPTWGEEGYIRIEFGQNECLITTAPSSSIAAGSHPPTPPTPPSPPSPPSPPASGSFTQYVCPSAFCLSGCQQNTLNTGVCLALQGGGSAIASCGAELTLQVFQTSDCTGSSENQQQPLNQCVEDTAGTYIYNTCSSSVSKLPQMANVTLVRRH